MSYKTNPCPGSCHPYSGYGAYYEYPPGAVYHGFGAEEPFDCEQVWADAQAGGKISEIQKQLFDNSCDPPVPPGQEGTCAALRKQAADANFRGARAADKVRKGLNALGYGPLTLGVPWGGADREAWEKFTSDEGVAPGPGLVSKPGLCRMEEKLGGGISQARMNLGTLGWIALLVAGGALTVSYVSGRRKQGARTGRAAVPVRGRTA